MFIHSVSRVVIHGFTAGVVPVICRALSRC